MAITGQQSRKLIQFNFKKLAESGDAQALLVEVMKVFDMSGPERLAYAETLLVEHNASRDRIVSQFDINKAILLAEKI